jgi:hypothetical protein
MDRTTRSKKIAIMLKGSGFLIAILFLLLIVPVSLFSIKMDEALIDDVTAMITNAKKLSHTTFLIDTSESMNTFAYSDYIETCADAKRNINHSIGLCENSYSQCRNVESQAMCGVDLGCADIQTRCSELRDTRTKLNQFCADVESVYVEPGYTDTVIDPLTDARSKRYVGPWNPSETYTLDLCFYNWTEDTGGDVPAGSNSDHWSYSDPTKDYTDRRDWDCMTDGVEPPQEKGGLWLNWKYTTSLDAIKIILVNTHRFAYPPKSRGKRECFESEYYAVTEDSVMGTICYQEFETDPGAGPDMDANINLAKSSWKRTRTEVADADCAVPSFDVVISAVPGDGSGVDAVSAGCDICRTKDGGIVPCEQYIPDKVGETSDVDVFGITTSVDYVCCINFECTNPKCRDNDATCFSSGDPCNLGFYSPFDQDQSHCCDDLVCVEEGDIAGGCPSGAQYMPNGSSDDPTNQQNFKDNLLAVPGAPDEYSNVKLYIEISSLTFTGPVDEAEVAIYFGCYDADPDVMPGTEIIRKSYSSEVTTPEYLIADISAVDLEGCAAEGYDVGGTLKVVHDGTTFDKATANLDIKFFVQYDEGKEGGITVLDPTAVYYDEHAWESAGDPNELVSEYECKTSMYFKQSHVVNGGPGSCPSKHPSFEHCAHPDHTVIAADQWGSPKRTACSWLCRDEVVYDDPWKCRMFFSQMDTIQRGGPTTCASPCYNESTHTLEQCCTCISGAHGAYNYLDLEDPEGVKFSAAGATMTCSVSGFQEGIMENGKRTFISGFQAEVIKGHMKEVPYDAADNPFDHNTIRLSDAGYISPYDLTYTDPFEPGLAGTALPDNARWYYANSMFGKSTQYLQDSFVSLFETGKNDRRDVACIHDLISDFSGEDCEDCLDTGCCAVDIGGEHEACDYPAFWAKIPNTEGGHLKFPAKTLAGADMTQFRNTIRDFQGRGGSTLAETLYDVWRYLGGMVPAHDTGYAGVPYPSPYQSADPACFLNDTIILSGGQPHFDDNYKIATTGYTSQSCATGPCPYVTPDTTTDVAEPDSTTPYVKENWYLSALEEVAQFVTQRDFWHSDPACRVDIDRNTFGYENNPAVCTTATDGTGDNFIDKIHTVAIGDWVLASLYDTEGFLEDSLLHEAAIAGGGIHFGLTAETTVDNADYKTFNDLTSLFDQFVKSGSPADRAAGRPHWTSAAIQPFGTQERVRGPEAYFPVTIPIDNKTSRFWFGNLKKYYFDDASAGCGLIEIDPSTSENVYTSVAIPSNDCFAVGDTGADITDVRFRKLMAAGAAQKIKQVLTSTAAPCNQDLTSPCFKSGARNILYDNAVTMKELRNLSLGDADFTFILNRFKSENPALTDTDVVQVFDYIYGYDRFDDDSDGDNTNVRYTGADATVTVDDPFDLSFDGTNTTTIRPLLLGAIIHSTPIAVYYEDVNSTRIFAGANDGMLHSFDQDGNETFAYIPTPVLPALTAVSNHSEGILFKSFVDGPLKLIHFDDNKDGMITDGEKAYLIFGYRRGANYYTVIDISVMDDPQFVQHIPVPGQSWAKPLIFNKGNDKYLVLAGGYDSCFDPDIPTLCTVTASGDLNPAGNEVHIYRYNSVAGNFGNSPVKTILPDDNDPPDKIRDTEWLRAPLVADPIAINTGGTLERETEFVYLIDISGTVFRVDVRNNNPMEWKFRAVYTQRANAFDTTGVWLNWRTYNSFVFYPPWTRYPSEMFDVTPDSRKVPIPILTGNLVNPRYIGRNLMTVFYDTVEYNHVDPPLRDNGANFVNIAGALVYDTSIDTTKDGWKVFLEGRDINTGQFVEKGIRRPLIYYDRWEHNTYTLVWNTYLPSDWGQCRGFGTSRNYAKNLWTGTRPQLGPYSGFSYDDYWDPGRQISVATDVSVVASKEGEHITFGSGDEMFLTKTPISPPNNVANIIKWYELY